MLVIGSLRVARERVDGGGGDRAAAAPAVHDEVLEAAGCAARARSWTRRRRRTRPARRSRPPGRSAPVLDQLEQAEQRGRRVADDDDRIRERGRHSSIAAAVRVVPEFGREPRDVGCESVHTTSLAAGRRARVTPEATIAVSQRIGLPARSAAARGAAEPGRGSDVGYEVDHAAGVDHPHDDALASAGSRPSSSASLRISRERSAVDLGAVADVVAHDAATPISTPCGWPQRRSQPDQCSLGDDPSRTAARVAAIARTSSSAFAHAPVPAQAERPVQPESGGGDEAGVRRVARELLAVRGRDVAERDRAPRREARLAVAAHRERAQRRDRGGVEAGERRQDGHGDAAVALGRHTGVEACGSGSERARPQLPAEGPRDGRGAVAEVARSARVARRTARRVRGTRAPRAARARRRRLPPRRCSSRRRRARAQSRPRGGRRARRPRASRARARCRRRSRTGSARAVPRDRRRRRAHGRVPRRPHRSAQARRGAGRRAGSRARCARARARARAAGRRRSGARRRPRRRRRVARGSGGSRAR